jgi:hypothetical protein
MVAYRAALDAAGGAAGVAWCDDVFALAAEEGDRTTRVPGGDLCWRDGEQVVKRALRMIVRWSIRLAAVVSLVLAVAVGGMWVRSYFVGDFWTRSGRESIFYFQHSRGRAISESAQSPRGWMKRPARWEYERSDREVEWYEGPGIHTWISFAGLTFAEGTMISAPGSGVPRMRMWVVGVGDWMLELVLLMLPGVMMFRWWRRGRELKLRGFPMEDPNAVTADKK